MENVRRISLRKIARVSIASTFPIASRKRFRKKRISPRKIGPDYGAYIIG